MNPIQTSLRGWNNEVFGNKNYTGPDLKYLLKLLKRLCFIKTNEDHIDNEGNRTLFNYHLWVEGYWQILRFCSIGCLDFWLDKTPSG